MYECELRIWVWFITKGIVLNLSGMEVLCQRSTAELCKEWSWAKPSHVIAHCSMLLSICICMFSSHLSSPLLQPPSSTSPWLYPQPLRPAARKHHLVRLWHRLPPCWPQLFNMFETPPGLPPLEQSHSSVSRCAGDKRQLYTSRCLFECLSHPVFLTVLYCNRLGVTIM